MVVGGPLRIGGKRRGACIGSGCTVRSRPFFVVWICAGRCPEDLLRVSRRAYGVTTDEAAPGTDTGKRDLGLPLPDGAGTGPVAEASFPGQPSSVYPSASGDNHAGQQRMSGGVEDASMP